MGSKKTCFAPAAEVIQRTFPNTGTATDTKFASGQRLFPLLLIFNSLVYVYYGDRRTLVPGQHAGLPGDQPVQGKQLLRAVLGDRQHRCIQSVILIRYGRGPPTLSVSTQHSESPPQHGYYAKNVPMKIRA